MDYAFTNIDDSIKHVTDALCAAAENMKRKISSPSKISNKWYDETCEALKRQRCQLLNKFRKSKDKRSFEEYCQKRNEYNAVCKQKRIDYYKGKQEEIENSISDSKRFWSKLKSLNKFTVARNNIDMDDWYEHFSNLFKNENENEDNTYDYVDEIKITTTYDPNVTVTEEMLDSPISREEILNSIKCLKPNKSPGMDDRIPEMIKNSADIIAPYLELI